ncbi:hypothetical protein DFP73DRAFT_149328 [Morchella snyderi]|nr:hypothetical protein DFP73DRAFT_149328 [Morchella snyderi]
MLLLSSTALAGPIGRYPLQKRHEGHDDPVPSPTTSTPASDAVSVSGAFFIPPPTEAPPTGGFRTIATVTKPRTFGFIEDGFQTALPAAASVGPRDVDTSATTTTTPAGGYAPTATAAEEGVAEAVGAPTSTTAEVTSSPAATAAAASSDNKALALAQNKFYATLTTASSCDPKDPNVLNACINGAYAQCNSAGSYVMYTQCGKPLGCFALPLENGPGISVACTSADDAAFRMGLKSGSELEEMLGGGGGGGISSVVPTSTVKSTVTVTSTSMMTATSTAAAVTSSASASASAPATSSAVVAPTSSASTAVPTTSSSAAAPTTTAAASSSSSSTSSTPTTTQAPVTTSSPAPMPIPTSTTAPPNNQAPVVTAIPIGERYVTSAGVVITTTIYQ